MHASTRRASSMRLMVSDACSCRVQVESRLHVYNLVRKRVWSRWRARALTFCVSSRRTGCARVFARSGRGRRVTCAGVSLGVWVRPRCHEPSRLRGAVPGCVIGRHATMLPLRTGNSCSCALQMRLQVLLQVRSGLAASCRSYTATRSSDTRRPRTTCARYANHSCHVLQPSHARLKCMCLQQVETALGGALPDDGLQIHIVRDVAPHKEMICITFRVPDFCRTAPDSAGDESRACKRPRSENVPATAQRE